MTNKFAMTLVLALLLILVAVMPASAVTVGTLIQPGATVFIGEEGLNIVPALGGYHYIAYWAPGTSGYPNNPSKVISLTGRETTFAVNPSEFVGQTGIWYQSNGAVGYSPAFYVSEPTLDIKVVDWSQSGLDVSGATLPQASKLGFKIDTNIVLPVDGTRQNATAPAATATVDTLPYTWATTTATTPSVDSIPYTWANTGSGIVTTGTFAQPTVTGSRVDFLITGLTGLFAPTTLTVDYGDGGIDHPTISGTGDAIFSHTYTTGGDFVLAIEYYRSPGNDRTYTTTTGVVLTSAIPPAGTLAQPTMSGTKATFSVSGIGSGVVLTVNYNDGSSENVTPAIVSGTATFLHTYITKGNFPLGLTYSKSGSLVTKTSNPVVHVTAIPLDPTVDGFMKIKVKTESGSVLSSIYTTNAGYQSLTNQFIDTQPFYWGRNNLSQQYQWDAAVKSGDQYVYPSGIYTVWAESDLNRMKDNYKNGGADYSGKTISAQKTVTFTSSTVAITPNKDTVVRSKQFSVTITGTPATEYYLWVKGTGSMSGIGTDNEPPMLAVNQEGVKMDAYPSETAIGSYVYENGKKIMNDTPLNRFGSGTDFARYYGKITTSTTGVRTVGFVTSQDTKAQRYTFRVERLDGTIYRNDECDVVVEKGAVSITASGDGIYYLGEEITLSGTNTETQATYLFLDGANLPHAGTRLNSPDPRLPANKVITGDETTFTKADVRSDNSFEYKWGTATVALDAGTYTVYAVSQPVDRETLGDAAYDTVSITLKKPFISATVSQSAVAKGDPISIIGTAEGKPSPGVQIWIIGKNYFTLDTESIGSDSSFKYVMKGADTKDLSSGQYFIVVQHPMANDKFDITYDKTTGYVRNEQLGTTGMTQFKLTGSGSLQGTDAAEALIEAINSPNVDDTYTKLVVLLEEPYIIVDQISDKIVGTKLTINAKTNLASGDEVFVEVYSTSFKPTSKQESGEYSGATGTLVVKKGETSGVNTLELKDIDTTTWKTDEYIVKMTGVVTAPVGTTVFNLVSGVLPTKTPVVNITATTVATPVPTPPTPIPTPVNMTTVEPTKTPAQPGFGAAIALIGLAAVAFLVVRRH